MTAPSRVTNMNTLQSPSPSGNIVKDDLALISLLVLPVQDDPCDNARDHQTSVQCHCRGQSRHVPWCGLSSINRASDNAGNGATGDVEH